MNAFFRFVLCFTLVIGSLSSLWANGNEEAILIRAYQKEKVGTKKYWRQINLGRYYQLNDIQKADSIRNYILASSRVENDSARVIALIFDLEVEMLRGNRAAYHAKILQLQPFLNRVNSPSTKVRIFHLLADYHIASRDFPEAQLYLDEAQIFAKKTRNYALLGENFRLCALMEMERNNKVMALNAVDQAIGYARRAANKSLLASCLNTQAHIYNYFGQVELSVSKNFIGLQLAKEANDFPKIADYERELGEAQFVIYNYREAERWILQSIEVARRIRDERLEGLALTDLGMVTFARKELPKAKLQLRDAIKILLRFNDNEGLGKAHMQLGNVFKEEGNYNEALRFYNQALVYFEAAGNRVYIASVFHLVGIVFEKQGKYANALNYLNRSVEIRKEFGYQGAFYPSYRAIAQVYRKTGNLKLAYQYLEMYSDFSDSAKTVEVSSKIAEISELYRAEQRERLIAIQADSIELQRKEKDLTSAQLENTQLRNIFQTYVIIGFLLLLLFGALFFYSRWKQRTIKQLQREAEMNQVLLRSQMNPHFVFNAMSVIQSYIYENDTKNSTKFLVNFSKLMRLILENSSKEFIPISTEMDILIKYLETQQLRFVDRFKFDVSVDKNLLDNSVVIPPMITQPFIENAIEHGQLHTIEGGFIHVRISKDEEMLHIAIIDNGVGRKGSEQNKKSKAHKSMAMKITQDRISILSDKYKIQGRLEVKDYDSRAETGTVVNIYLPYKTESEVPTLT
jgi:tetratricopeptide (TPR) repeat protein